MYQMISVAVFLGFFFGVIAVGELVLTGLYGDHRRAIARLRNLGPAGAATPENTGLRGKVLAAIPKIGNLVMPTSAEHLAALKGRLTQAGVYGPNALKLFLGVKILLILALPIMAGFVPYLLGVFDWRWTLVLGALACGVGLITPGLWLDHMRGIRQDEVRRAMPDLLDMLVLCVEAGMSLISAFQRVAQELPVVHPKLAKELNIIQRELQLGLSVGDALLKFGDRSRIDEVRNLAQVLIQSERFGTSSVKSLRTHADASRMERQQRAEEKAQKASVHILFPTMLCIFPAIFIVILGPAAYQMSVMFKQ
jgi:tight adherence protein C